MGFKGVFRMTDKTFEEQFPSLKEWIEPVLDGYSELQKTLQEYCLDKQKVREGINFILDNNRFTNKEFMKQVKEELEMELEL